MYTLLIADDEQLERQALRYIVEKECPRIRIVGETGDGNTAVQVALAEKPDIILMDIRMPGMNGLEAAKQIRLLLPDTIIIMLTAFDEFSYAKQAVKIGAVEYLLKPARPDDIIQNLQLTVQKVDEIRRRQQEERRLRKSVEEAIPLLQMSFIYDLILGNIADLAIFQERAQMLAVKIMPSVVLVVNIDHLKRVAYKNELEKQALKQKMYKLVCGVAGEHALVTTFGTDHLIVLLGFSEIQNNEVLKEKTTTIARKIQEHIIREINVIITIGIGRYYNDPREMHKSYLEALHAIGQKGSFSSSQCIHIDDVSALQPEKFSYPVQHERTVLEKVRCGERKQAKEALHQLLDEIFASTLDMDIVKAYVLELLIILSRSAVEGGAHLEQLTLLNCSYITALYQCEDKPQIKAWMFESLDHFMDTMLENPHSMNLRVINKACNYIMKNFQRNISLEEVAQAVHLSPFYFSRLFKQEKGYNFVDFLTEVRIEKAKKMLKNPELTAVRIAAEVGYQDASYFSRVFRQTMGMTPNQYRNEIRG